MESPTNEKRNNLSFPGANYFHEGVPIEWFYLAGSFDTGDSFHFSYFKAQMGGLRNFAVHSSVHNGTSQYREELYSDLLPMNGKCGYLASDNRFFIECDQFALTLFPKEKPVIHDVPLNRNYYSIPFLEGQGHIYKGKEPIAVTAQAWLDHEFSDVNTFRGWDWVGLKLNSGMSVMAYASDVDNFCTVSWGDRSYHPSFLLTKNSLVIEEMGLCFYLEPLVKEEIFKPKFGVSYSEVPINVVVGDKVIGTGFHEKTYRGARGRSA